MRKLCAVLLWAILTTACAPQEQAGGVVLLLDPALDAIVSSDAKVEKLAEGFNFLEGPVWFAEGEHLIFSDIPANNIYKWNRGDGKVSVLLEKSGFTGDDPTGIGPARSNGKTTVYNIGSNGIAKDPQGRIVFSAMGDRQIVRLEPDGSRTVLASHYEGKRLNSTNDLVYTRDGTLYFTDPPSGLKEGNDDPRKELPYNGIFALKDGNLRLVTSEVTHPNGLTFSPDEKVLYAGDTRDRIVVRFDVLPDGSLANPSLFADMRGDPREGNPDGMKVDEEGNLYSCGAGGIWVISPEGKHLGTIVFPERPSNFTFGGEDARTLYVTARTGLYSIRVNIPGIQR